MSEPERIAPTTILLLMAQLARCCRAAPHSPVPMVTMLAVSETGAPAASRVKLAEIEVPRWVNARLVSVGDAVRPTNNGLGVNVPITGKSPKNVSMDRRGQQSLREHHW